MSRTTLVSAEATVALFLPNQITINIRVRGQRRQFERSPSGIGGTLPIARQQHRLQGIGRGGDSNPTGGAFFEANLAMVLLHILCGAVVDQGPMLQEEEDLVKKRHVSHERLSNLAECEPSGGLFSVLVDDEVSVLFVYLRASRYRASVEVFLECCSLRFVNFFPREPSCQKPRRLDSFKLN